MGNTQDLAADGAPPLLAASGVLALEGVSVCYPGSPSPALADVSLSVGEGEFVALVGANGSGKSTLLRAACALGPVTRGVVRLGGRDVLTMRRTELARKVAFVSQAEAIATGFRVRAVVAMGRAPHQGSWLLETERDRVAVDEAIERCDLQHLVGRFVETLSGGEQRRVALARALAQRPGVMLLDEPAAFLDVRHRLELYECLVARSAVERPTVLCAMHDLDTADRFASRVVLMRSGRVVASGRADEVLTAAKLREVLGAELAVGTDEPSGHRYFLPLHSSRIQRQDTRAPDGSIARSLRRP